MAQFQPIGEEPSMKDMNSTAPKQPWYRFHHRNVEDQIHKNLSSQFSGGRGWNGIQFYRKPKRVDPEHQDHVALTDRDYGGSLTKDTTTGKFTYLNQFGQESSKYSDVAVYLSPTNFMPKRLIVQSTGSVLHHDLGSGDWRRTKISGDVPTVLTVCEWALWPFRFNRWYRNIDGAIRVLLVSIPVQILIALPIGNSWDDDDTVDTYTDFPGYHWQWAKHAINPLDRKPHSNESTLRKQDLTIPSLRQRLLRPRQLVVQQSDGTWHITASAPKGQKYIFISFMDKAFPDDKGKEQIERMAERAAVEAGCQAYWLDFRCRAPQAGTLLDLDIYHMCDVIRGSERVVVMLPDDNLDNLANWGSRMWTLPEGLLAPNSVCHVCRLQDDGLITETRTLIQLTGHIWEDRPEDDRDGEGDATRLLAEHFQKKLTLSRLELFSIALKALYERSRNDYTFFTRSDIAYALMGLLHYRIERDDTDTAFQSLAQLSLSNDSDRIVERMISLYPKAEVSHENPFYSLAVTDQFHTHLWDIHPTCQVVGVAYEDNTVLVDSCRAMHIRWKSFPRPAVVRDNSWSRVIAGVVVAAATWWLIQGISLTIYYAPFLQSLDGNSYQYTIDILTWMIAGFLFVAVLLSCFGPGAVRRLYGGKVLQSTSNLVGFEGVMPIDKLERIVFGQCDGRLSYEASSTPFAEKHRHDRLRMGTEPDWVKNGNPDLEALGVPRNQRLFTLVDTGELSVSIFSAERPPTVAMLCGREGGMLRAVLCSWQFENDCLYKEAVLRMPSTVSDWATAKGWVKLCLKSLNQARRDEQIWRAEQKRKKEEQRQEELDKKEAPSSSTSRLDSFVV